MSAKLADFRLPPRSRGLLAWSYWDVASVLAAIAHLAFIVWLVTAFGRNPLWLNAVCAGAYAVSISWNINSVSHNFIHTPYFRSKALNYAFSLLESVAVGFSQTYYRWVHLRHHEGNSDRPDANGKTRDPLSIYLHGKDGNPESVWSYVFLGPFRSDDEESAFDALRARRPFDAYWGRVELAAAALFVIAMCFIDWRAVLFLAPFRYFGECLSQLNGYYEHFRADPDVAIAWGASSYAPIYNVTWFNNGHHAEHHFRPAVHWTRLPALRRAIRDLPESKSVHVISTAHAFGFLARENTKPSL